MEIPTGKCDLGGMHSTCVARSGPTKSAAASAAAVINTSSIVFPFAEGVGVRVGSDLRRRRRHPIPSKHEPEHILQFHGRIIILELVMLVKNQQLRMHSGMQLVIFPSQISIVARLYIFPMKLSSHHFPDA